MSIKSQQANMKTIFNLVSQNLSYIFGERESGPNGAKKQFHTKSAAFLRTLGNDLGLREFTVHKNYAGIAVSGEITLMGLWSDGNGVYFQLFQSVTGRKDFLYRHITHMKDYTGGLNQWMDWNLFMSGDYDKLIDRLLSLKESSEETTNTVIHNVA
jgi:hypothetical protein